MWISLGMLASSGLPDLWMEVGREGGRLGLFIWDTPEIWLRGEDSGARMPGFESQLCHLAGVTFWASNLISLF